MHCVNVKEWKYQYLFWMRTEIVKKLSQGMVQKMKVESEEYTENLIFWLWLSKCNIIWAYFHCSAVQRNPLQFSWKLLWKLATVHFSEIDSIWTKVIDEFMIYQNWWISNRRLRGRGWGDFWLTTFEYVACLLQILLVDLDQSTNLSQNVRMHVP